MNKSSTVTCSFTMDRNIYNAYKSVVSANGENVKGNLINYMKEVIAYNTPNPETIQAIGEVQKLKNDPNKKTYDSFNDLLKEVEDEL